MIIETRQKTSKAYNLALILIHIQSVIGQHYRLYG